MKKTIIDRFLFLLISVLTLIPAGKASASPADWAVSPSDFRYDMSLYFTVAIKATGVIDYDSYDVAAFYGDQCRGVAQTLDLPDGSRCLSMRIRSNVASGEDITFKIRNRESGEVTPIEGVTIPFVADSRVGYPSEPYAMVIVRYYDVTVTAGAGGSVDFTSGRYEEGTVLTLTAVPAEGHSFETWSDGVTEASREVTVTEDIFLEASFVVNSYNLVYVLDGTEISRETVLYGTELTPAEAPEKEGYTFSGWSEMPATMPAHDVTVTGSFAINSYTVTFRIGDEFEKSFTLEYGAEIVAPEAPAKEGHTFAGWQDMPAVVPAHDVTILGSYTVNLYKLVYMVDGEEYLSQDVAYGSELTPAEAPVKEGFTFSGWSEMPATMPAHDVTVAGSFSINSYTVTFRIEDEFEKSFTLEYGAEIVAPEAPAKEGHTFAGWQDMPATVPAHDVTVLGSYTVNAYKIVYMVDGEEYLSQDVAFGTELTPAEAPVKEGYTFSGWSEMPVTMPAHDVTVTGSFAINSYTVTFRIGDEFEKSFTLEFGAEIVAPEAPAKDGYTFAGWQDMPGVVPAHDVTVLGSYTVNVYKLVYMVDGEEYLSQDVAYGTELTPAEAPEKEGYTFSGWSEMPATMPAHDVTVTGSFAINSYTLTVLLNEMPYFETILEYGTPIEIPEPEIPDDMEFCGWEPEPPATMPAHDLVINGTTRTLSGLERMIADGETQVTVHTLTGVCLYRDASPETIKERLQPGIYIVNGRKVILK